MPGSRSATPTYFSGKDALAHELYLSVQREHRDRTLPLLRGGAPLVFSWLHVDDVARAVDHIADQPEISCPVNVASPNTVTNAEIASRTRRGLLPVAVG
ncbi:MULTISPECIES: hypothetical protein [Mumia]|uniref:hypothetical protein n=1 Tax=Mumia TaxID=1546255 RepID=UPI001AB04D44|nr:MULTISPECIES: hypothetical protein [unclassified Mumia]